MGEEGGVDTCSPLHVCVSLLFLFASFTGAAMHDGRKRGIAFSPPSDVTKGTDAPQKVPRLATMHSTNQPVGSAFCLVCLFLVSFCSMQQPNCLRFEVAGCKHRAKSAATQQGNLLAGPPGSSAASQTEGNV